MKKPNKKDAVALATDVLSQLAARKLVAITGIYFSTTVGLPLLTKAEQLADGKKGESCEVCALGALFMKRLEHGHAGALEYVLQQEKHNERCIKGGEEWMIGTHFNRDAMVEAALLDAFTATELRNIEMAFESTGWGPENPRPWATLWSEAFNDSQDRLAAIMLAIVRDGGAFTPKTEIPKANEVLAALTPPKPRRKVAKRGRR